MRLGSRYGGWCVPLDAINSGSVCYSVGVGEDVSFDLELIARTGCTVMAFDPTPKAIEFVKSISLNPRFLFVPNGVWSSDAVLRFYAPAEFSHVSHSIVNLQGTERFFEAQCFTLRTLMRRYGHDHLDCLKLDIEGAEYAVIEDMLNSGVVPRIFCVEFDQPTPLTRILKAVRALSGAGYRPIAVDGWNITFRRADGDLPAKAH